MRFTHKRVCRGAAAAGWFLLAATASPAFAEVTAARKSQARLAPESHSLVLRELRRKPTALAEPARAIDALAGAISRPAPGASLQRSATGDYRTVQPDYVATVSEDGRRGRIVHRPLPQRAQRALAERPGHRTMELRALQVVRGQLADLIVEGPDEELYAEDVLYEYSGGADPEGNNAKAYWSGSRVVLGRAVRGNPVLGGGSRVVLGFDADGVLESIDYDWPELVDTGTEQRRTVRLDAIVDQVARDLPAQVRMGLSEGFQGRSEPDADGRVRVADNVEIEEVRCGYLDSDEARQGAGDRVPTGCVIHTTAWVEGSEGRTRIAIVSELEIRD